MLGWTGRAPDGRTFGDVYRRQYQQTRASRASKVGRVVGPILLPIALVLGSRVGPLFEVVTRMVTVVLLFQTVVLTRRQRLRHSGSDHAPHVT